MSKSSKTGSNSKVQQQSCGDNSRISISISITDDGGGDDENDENDSSPNARTVDILRYQRMNSRRSQSQSQSSSQAPSSSSNFEFSASTSFFCVFNNSTNNTKKRKRKPSLPSSPSCCWCFKVVIIGVVCLLIGLQLLGVDVGVGVGVGVVSFSKTTTTQQEAPESSTSSSSSSRLSTDGTSSSAAAATSNPSSRRFSQSLHTTLELRGANFLTPKTGCHVASWVYQNKPPSIRRNPGIFIECRVAKPNHFQQLQEQQQQRQENATTTTTTLLNHTSSSSYYSYLPPWKYHPDQHLSKEIVLSRKIQPYDTVYVNWGGLQKFVEDILPLLEGNGNSTGNSTNSTNSTTPTHTTAFTPIVLICGSEWLLESEYVPLDVQQRIVSSPAISHWFVQNMDYYLDPSILLLRRITADSESKISSWPYGIKPRITPGNDPSPYLQYEETFWKTYRRDFGSIDSADDTSSSKTTTGDDEHDDHETTTALSTSLSTRNDTMTTTNDDDDHRKGIMHGYFNIRNNPEGRNEVPVGPRLSFVPYLDELSHHKFILSPNGDRPECYRHYEAIGLGTIPITSLHPEHYSHFIMRMRDEEEESGRRGSSSSSSSVVLFNTTEWNLTTTEAIERFHTEDPNPIHHNRRQQPPPEDDQQRHYHLQNDNDGINRLLILQEYWLEYAERQISVDTGGVGKSLRWFDRLQTKQVPLKDFVTIR